MRLSVRTWLLIALGVVGAVGAVIAWLGYEATQAKSQLEYARAEALQAKDALARADADEASRRIDAALEHAVAAREATHSLPWSAGASVPWVGRPLLATRQISDVVVHLVRDVLRPAVDTSEAISPERFLGADGRIDLPLLEQAAPALADVAREARTADTAARDVVDPAYLAPVRDARAALRTQTSYFATLLERAAVAARLLPPMLGADGPRTYFLGFQTNAEARGTGGLLGGFGILRVADGRASVDTLGRNTELNRPFAPIDLGPEFTAQYGYVNPTVDVRNSNLSPHFPYAARIWQSMWEQQSGERVDGVIALDPVALSDVLGVTGPVTMPDGETVTADNVVELTESTAYLRFADDNDARKQYLQDIAGEVVTKVTSFAGSHRALLDALAKAAAEQRISVWSDHPDEQALIEDTVLAHVVPDDPGPYAQVLVNNLGGNKLDYYLTRQIVYSAAGCDADRRSSTVTLRLRNDAPSGALPGYVAGSFGLADGPVRDVPEGTNVASVSLVATQGAELTAAYVDGRRVAVFTGMERGHPVFDAQLRIERGATIEVTFELTEPTAPGAARVPVQPLRDSPTPTVTVPACG